MLRNFHNSINSTDKIKSSISHQSDSIGRFNKFAEKCKHLQYDLERRREEIEALRNELAAKNREISLLKVSKNKKEEEYNKNMRVISEIMKKSDKSTSKGFELMASSMKERENNKAAKREFDGGELSGDNNRKLPEIKEMIHLNEDQKDKIKGMVHINLLKQHIEKLNKKVEQNQARIKELEKNKNTSNFNKLKNNFIKNINELEETKKESEKMKLKFEEISFKFQMEKENNMQLKTKYKGFKRDYKEYKEKSESNKKLLKCKLELAALKERECRIFHVNRCTDSTILTPYSTKTGLLNSNKSDSENFDRLRSAEKEMKKLNRSVIELRNEKESQEEEIKSLKESIKSLEKQIKLMGRENENLTKLNKELKGKLRQNKQENSRSKITREDNSIIEGRIDELNGQINKLEFDLEKERKNTEAIKELLTEKERENNSLFKTVSDLQKIIDDLKNQLAEKDSAKTEKNDIQQAFVTDSEIQPKEKNEKKDDKRGGEIIEKEDENGNNEEENLDDVIRENT